MTQSIGDAYAEWEEKTLSHLLKRFPERKKTFQTSSGIPIKRCYLPTDSDPDYFDKLGFPGELPDHVPQPALDHAPLCGNGYG